VALLAALPGADVVLTAQAISGGLLLTAAERGPTPLQQLHVSQEAGTRGLHDTLGRLLAPLSQPRALLTLATDEPQARVHLGAHLLGRGPLQERRIAPGPQALSVEAEGYQPFQRELSPQPGETLEVRADLLPEPPAAVATASPPPTLPVQRLPRGAALWERPGFYVGLAGVLALGMGLGLGASASSVQARALDANGDGVLDITRAEARSAEWRALAANVLLGVGALGLGVGGVWLALAPAAGPVRADGTSAVGGQLVALGHF
jgi:hypothetical protein